MALQYVEMKDFFDQHEGALLAVATVMGKRDNYTHLRSRNVANYPITKEQWIQLNEEKLEKFGIVRCIT